MEPKEASVMLAKVTAYDRRTVGKADAIAWAEAMTKANVAMNDALQAVTDHFSESTDWLMPAHVIRRVVAIRKTRMAAAGEPPFPPDLTVGQEIAWRRHWIDGLGHGRDSAGAARYADGAMNILRPALSAPEPGRLTAIIGGGLTPDPFSRGL